MPTPRLRRVALFTLALGCATWALAAQELRKLSPVELSAATKRMDKSLLPVGATDFVIEREQAMALGRDHGVTLLPVRFGVPNPGGGGSPFFQCGIVFLSSDAPAKLLIIFGTDWTEAESCLGLQAIGAVKDQKNPAGQPALALIYKASTTRESFPEPVILASNKDGYYEPDPKTSQWLGQQKAGHTIAGIRRLLLKRWMLHADSLQVR